MLATQEDVGRGEVAVDPAERVEVPDGAFDPVHDAAEVAGRMRQQFSRVLLAETPGVEFALEAGFEPLEADARDSFLPVAAVRRDLAAKVAGYVWVWVLG